MSCTTKIVTPVAITGSTIVSSNLEELGQYATWAAGSTYHYGEVVNYKGALMRSNVDSNANNRPVMKLGANPNFAAVPWLGLFEYDSAGNYSDIAAFDATAGYTAGDRFYDPRQNNLVVEVLSAVSAGVYPPIFTSDELNGDTSWDFWRLSNPLSLFDLRANDQTISTTDTMSIVLRPRDSWTHLALFGVSASSVSIVIEDSNGAEIYNESIIPNSGASDWWEYFYAYDDLSTDLVIDVGGAGYLDKTLTLTLEKTNSNPAIGILFLGQEEEIGETLIGINSGGRSFSEVASNSFGVTGISTGSTIRDLDVPTSVSNDDFDIINQSMRNILGQVVLMIGTERFNTTIAYGLAKEFNLNVQYSDTSSCTFTMESLI